VSLLKLVPKGTRVELVGMNGGLADGVGNKGSLARGLRIFCNLSSCKRARLMACGSEVDRKS
jgi:hypothetical protein